MTSLKNPIFMGFLGVIVFLVPLSGKHRISERNKLFFHVEQKEGEIVQRIEKTRVKCGIQFSLVIQSYPNLCDPMDCSTPGLPVHHQLPEFAQTHVHWVGEAIQPSHPLWSPSPPGFNLFQWVSSSHQLAKALEFQLQHQSFQWTLRT